MNENIKEKLANSLTAKTPELIPFLPYLLQDLWEIGSSPYDMIRLAVENIRDISSKSFLDLACGKGAVSVKFSKALDVRMTGIDIIGEFIEYAKEKASEYEVSELCNFKTGDINQAVEYERNYDGVIFGAVGNILGAPQETIEKLKKTVKPYGYIFLDESFLRNKNTSNRDIYYGVYDYLHYEQWIEIFDKTGVKLLGEIIVDEEALEDTNSSDISFISKRASELALRYPGKKKMFDGYVQSQKAEISDLEENVLGVTWLLQKLN